jgi:hypothetical protein
MTEEQAEWVSGIIIEIKTLRDAIELIKGPHSPNVLVRQTRFGNNDKWQTTEVNLPRQLNMKILPILEQELKEMEEELSTFETQ